MDGAASNATIAPLVAVACNTPLVDIVCAQPSRAKTFTYAVPSFTTVVEPATSAEEVSVPAEDVSCTRPNESATENTFVLAVAPA